MTVKGFHPEVSASLLLTLGLLAGGFQRNLADRAGTEGLGFRVLGFRVRVLQPNSCGTA